MSYIVPAAADLKARFPVFAAVDDAVVTNAIAFAATRVSDAWTDADAVEGIYLYAAHTMTLDGLGTSNEAKEIISGLAGVRSYSTGSFRVDRGDAATAESLSSTAATSYGRRYQQLLKLNVPSATVA